MKLTFAQLFRLLFIACAIIFSASLLFAWTGPTATAPAGNVSAPINVGTTDQVKNAGLSVNALTVFGTQYIQDKLGIGRVSPVVALDVNGTLRLASGGEACQSVTAGSVRYSSSVLEFCDGSLWSPIANPVGSIVAMPTASCPTGYLAANGAAVSRTTYASLFSSISTMYGAGNGSTTFTLPDYRGYFLRGWANGSTVDPDKASRTNRGDGTTGDSVGTKQADQLASHTHTSGTQGPTYFTGESYTYSFSGASSGSTGATGGNETRPKNINVLYCIKY